jgi:hypothetical protein
LATIIPAALCDQDPDQGGEPTMAPAVITAGAISRSGQDDRPNHRLRSGLTVRRKTRNSRQVHVLRGNQVITTRAKLLAQRQQLIERLIAKIEEESKFVDEAGLGTRARTSGDRDE